METLMKIIAQAANSHNSLQLRFDFVQVKGVCKEEVWRLNS